MAKVIKVGDSVRIDSGLDDDRIIERYVTAVRPFVIVTKARTGYGETYKILGGHRRIWRVLNRSRYEFSPKEWIAYRESRQKELAG